MYSSTYHAMTYKCISAKLLTWIPELYLILQNASNIVTYSVKTSLISIDSKTAFHRDGYIL